MQNSCGRSRPAKRGLNADKRVGIRTWGAKINLIDERTRAELPLRDVGPFRHFRHYINEETRRAAPARLPAPQWLQPYRNVRRWRRTMGNIAIPGTSRSHGSRIREAGTGGTPR